MGMRKIAWTLAVLAATGSAAWSQSPRTPIQTTEAAVTPKVVLPAKPKVVPQTVPVSYQQTEVIADAQSVPAGVKMMDIIVPAAAREAKSPGVVQASTKAGGPVKTLAVETPVPVQKSTTSRFVPAQRLEEGQPSKGPIRNVGAVVPASATVEGPVDAVPAVVNGPAPVACQSGCPTCAKNGVATGDKWHALINWFTYCPKGNCGHPCPPAPYIPRNFMFFLDRCAMAKNLKPLPPPPPAPASCHPH